MIEVREEWLSKLFDCKLQFDEKKAQKGIEWLYELSGLKKPTIIFIDSPMGVQLGAELAIRYLEALKGASVRDSVRASVWASVRASVWASVRASVEDSVRASVEDSVRASVEDSVEDSVWASVRASVGASVRASVGASVWDSVRDSVWDSVEDSVRASVRDSVGDSVRASVGASVWDRVFSYYGNIGDWGWNAFYEFFELVDPAIFQKKDLNNLHKFRQLLDSGIYDMVQLDGLCVVSKLPTRIKRDEQHRLHNDLGPAIEFGDGYYQNYLWGIYLDDELFLKVINKKMTFKQIMKLENMEQRMVVLKYYGAEKLLKDSKAKLLDGKTEKGNELFLVKNIFSQPAYFLKYTCPSTGRQYVKGIDPIMGKKGNADECQAWSFSLTLNEYISLTAEA